MAMTNRFPLPGAMGMGINRGSKGFKQEEGAMSWCKSGICGVCV